MDLRHLNWAAIALGSGAGLFSSLLLFVVLMGLGRNGAVQLLILAAAFFVSGFVAGRFTLTEPRLSGGFAALGAFFVIALLSLTGGNPNLVGLIIFGGAAILVGQAGGAAGYNRALKS